MRRIAAFAVLLAVAGAAFPLGAQERVLAVGLSATRPTIDGVLSDGEYASSLSIGVARVAVSRSAEALTIAVSAQTLGWVSVGIGSGRMDGATIFIGYVSQDGLQLKPQVGRGHSHGDAPSDALVASAGSERGGWTTIELTLKPDAFIAPGQNTLSLIVAYGAADSFSGMHAGRWNLTVDLGK